MQIASIMRQYRGKRQESVYDDEVRVSAQPLKRTVQSGSFSSKSQRLRGNPMPTNPALYPAGRATFMDGNRCSPKNKVHLSPSEIPTLRVSRPIRIQTEHPCVLVWYEDGCKSSLVDKYLHDGEPTFKEVDTNLIYCCIKDGVTIKYDGDRFVTDGLSTDASMLSSWWRNLVAPVQIADNDGRPYITTDGGIGCLRVGVGTFNAVVVIPSEQLPKWLPKQCVVRFTRPDVQLSNEFMYQNYQTTFGELLNTLFASLNDIGPAIYSVAVFNAPRTGRTLRFGVVYTMEVAHRDLGKSLKSMRSFNDGCTAAVGCIELLYKASRLGIAFFDIKPGNLLEFIDESNSTKRAIYKLTDFDPAFFIRTKNRDWRSLLLLNLALLSAHVYALNCEEEVIRGWVTEVTPLLQQLVARREEYESSWLFLARCANLKFRQALDDSDFELQRMFTSICESYFYGERRRGTIAHIWHWKRKSENNEDLKKHWSTAKNIDSWPETWTTAESEPLVVQLVKMSTCKSRR